jgi:predicted MFS family arabinose efflux permease
MKIGSWVIIAVLLAILVATISPGYEGWTVGRDYIAMALGLFFSMVIGIGLMTLVFYSSAATREKHYALC